MPIGLSVDEFRDFVQIKVLTPTIAGFIIGASRGYYLSNAPIPYAYTYGIGTSLGATMFFSTAYVFAYARGVDDVWNHSASGLLTGGWLTSLVKGPRLGILGAGLGAVAGGFLKLSGDWAYEISREEWLRIQKINSKRLARPS